MSYIASPVRMRADSDELKYHSNRWESREICHILTKLGYDVDAIDFDDTHFVPKREYDIVFDIYTNLHRLESRFSAQTIKLLHATGSDPYYQNAAELARINALNARRGSQCTPKRLIASPEQSRRAFEAADFCSLIGNSHTVSTYPEHIRSKMTCVPVSASQTGSRHKKRHEFVPEKREFLWYFGSGAVHKGLDLLLEVFAQNPGWTLNIVGYVNSEADFVETFWHELHNLPNIRNYDALRPDSDAFHAILKDVFCVVAPTCSEEYHLQWRQPCKSGYTLSSAEILVFHFQMG
ncbi:MAG: glycosyltransferase [Chloroflexi bacterium]|nr:glycosyltransferase [Chloroflexota bacterium]